MGKKPTAHKVTAKKSGFQRKHSDIFKKISKIGHENEPAKKNKKNKNDMKEHMMRASGEADEKILKTSELESKVVVKQEMEAVEKKEKKTGKKPRFILFVGNLPYTTTKESLEKHFKKAGPLQEIRILLNAEKEPKGCAFVEYKTSAGMLNALLYHHTTFEDRKINVEMTVGGGGNSSKRKKKIQQKRNKSNELIHKMLVQKKKSQSISAPIK